MMKRLSSSAAMLLVLILAGGMFYYSRLDNSSSFGDAIHGAVETMGKGVKDNVSMEEENKGSGTTTKQLPASTEKADGTEAGTTADEKKTEAGTTAATASTREIYAVHGTQPNLCRQKRGQSGIHFPQNVWNQKIYV